MVAKRHLYERFEVFNELVAAHLGRFLGLPIPVGFVLEKSGEPYYCSGNVSLTALDFPPADFEHFAANQPRLACGIALFDGWICNADRHAKNLFYDADDGTTFLIDQGNALLNSFGVQHLRQSEDELKLREQYRNELVDFDSFAEWHGHLCRIPEHTIRSAVTAAAAVGVSYEDAFETGNFLLARRTKLPKLFRDNQGLFPKFDPNKSLYCPF